MIPNDGTDDEETVPLNKKDENVTEEKGTASWLDQVANLFHIEKDSNEGNAVTDTGNGHDEKQPDEEKGVPVVTGDAPSSSKRFDAKLSEGGKSITESGVYYDAKAAPSTRSTQGDGTAAMNIDTALDDQQKNAKRALSPKSAPKQFEYKTFKPEEFAKWIGFPEETECDELVDNLGIEELSVYSREMSQSASNCCVYGCNLAKLKFVSIEELEDMIDEAWDDVREANVQLLRARAEVFRKENHLPEPKEGDEFELESEKDDENDADDENPKMPSIREEVEKEDPSSNEDPRRPINIEEKRTSGSMSSFMSASSGLRQRGAPSARDQYGLAQSMVRGMQGGYSGGKEDKPKKERGCFGRSDSSDRKPQKVRDKVIAILDHPTFAVVTFTSRQAAIAARQCLADGKGVDRWMHVDDIPVAPLGKFKLWTGLADSTYF
jgi:hypothetical protein